MILVLVFVYSGSLIEMTTFVYTVVLNTLKVFTCDNPGAFRSIYSPKSQDKVKTLETLADQLVTLCATLDEYPGIRYKK